MRKFLPLISLILVLLILPVSVVYAAYSYSVPISVYNNSTTDYSNLPILVSINNSQLYEMGYIDVDGLDTDVQEGATSREFMVESSRLGLFVPSILEGQTRGYNYRLGDTDGQTGFPVITGVGGNVTVSDNASLELGDNFTVEVDGWIDTSSTGSCSSWALDFDGTAYGESADKSTFAWMHGKGNVASFNFTIELRMRTDTPEPDAIYPLVTTCDLTSLDTGVYFGIDDRSGAGHSRALVLHIYQSDSGQPVFDAYIEDAYPNDTDWHHIAVTYDQSLANTNGVFYVDGVAVGTDDKTANAPNNADSSDELHLGSDGPEAFFFTGDLDEVRISNAVRTPEEIESDWLEVCPDVDASTFALWHLDEGTGATANDSSATSADLTLTNTEWTAGCGGDTRCLVRKPGAFYCHVPGVGSNITALIPGEGSVTATGVSSGEHTIEVKQDLSAHWWDANWAARKKLTFDNSGCSENLTNVPVAVSLDDTNFDFSKAQADGDDVRFIDADDTTELDYFWEVWDSANETAIAWVEVPQIDAGSTTDSIYLYWGNNAASNAEDMNGVYTANTTLASTYASSNSTFLTDATAYGNDGTITGAAWAQLSSGLWHLDFDGTNDYVDCGSDASLYPDRITLEAWVQFKTVGSVYKMVFSCDDVGNRNYAFSLWNNDKLRFYIYDSNVEHSISSTSTPSQDTWMQMVATYDGAHLRIYTNGALDCTPAAYAGNIDSDSEPVKLGERGDGGLDLDGYIALPRIYNRALSAEEIENHFNQEKHLFGVSDGFITFGDAEYGGLRLYIDGVLEDYGATVNVTDNANDWVLMSDAIPYMDCMKITVDETLVAWYEPNMMIAGSVLTDREGGDHNGVINWGSNPDGIEITVGGLEGVVPVTSAYEDEAVIPDLLPTPEDIDYYSDVEEAELANMPQYDAVSAVADSLGMSTKVAYVILMQIVAIAMGVAGAIALGGPWGFIGGFGFANALALGTPIKEPIFIILGVVIVLLGVVVWRRMA